MPDQRFVLELETIIKLSTGDVLTKVRSLFNELRAEGQRAIQSGSQTGISHLSGLYTSALGITGAFAANRPGITGPQQSGFEAVLRRAEAEYGRLQIAASEQGLSLRSLTRLDEAQQRGSKLLQEALTRQSNAKLQEAAAAEALAAAERRAATEDERRAALNQQRNQGLTSGLYGPPAPPPGSKYATDRPLYGPPAPGPDRPLYGPPAPAPGSKYAPPLYGPPAPVPGQSIGSQAAVLEATRALTIKADIAREQAINKDFLEAKAKSTIAERERAAAIARATREEAIAQGQGGGSFFQRLQATVHARGGFGGAGTGADTRLPSDYQSFGQFLTSKALTTGGFALSGAVLYGAISGFKQITQEASALQRELAIVKGQFEKLGDTQGFADFAKQVTQISVNTGIAADQVALVARQLSGVFRDSTTGAADFNKALSETQVALKLTQVTGLPLQEITDSLTAITTSLGSSFTTIGDLAIGLEQRFGVLAPQIIAFAADVAPVAQALGFTVEQISALGAIAQQRSGVAGSALADSFNRALPAIQNAGVKIAELFNQRPETAQFVNPVISALGTGQGAVAIKELTKAYAAMTQNQRQALAELLGGPRAAKAFFAVLQGGKDTIDALNGSTGQYAGSLDQRFHDFQDTVDFAFEKARRSLEAFGLALFNSGLADGLKLIADNGALLFTVMGKLLQLLGSFNDALGGIPIKLLAIYAAMKLITAIGGGIGGFAVLANTLRSGGQTPGSPLSGITFLSSSPAAKAPYSDLPYARSGGVFAPGAATGLGQSLESAAAGTGAKAALANMVSSVAPLIAALAVAQMVQTIGEVNAQIKQAQANLDQQVAAKLQQGLKPEDVISRIPQSGYNSATGSKAGDVALKVFTFGTADTTSPGDKAVDNIQKANAERQGKEIDAIAATLSDKDRKQLEDLKKLFLADPANNKINDVVARYIAARHKNGTDKQIAELDAIAKTYADQASSTVALQASTDYAPVLEEVRARYESGAASLSELLDADRTQLANFKQILDNTLASQQNRLDAAKGFAQQQKQTDSDITTAAQRAADITIKLAGLSGGDITKATTQARLQQLQTTIAQGASPSTVLDAALSALDAQQQELDKFINSPVIQNGIARAPTAAEKIARSQQGAPTAPGVREAFVKAQVSLGATFVAVKALAEQQGKSVDQEIDDVTQLILQGDTVVNHSLSAAIQSEIETLQHLADSLGNGRSAAEALPKAKIEEAISSLRTSLAGLAPVQDPGSTIKGSSLGDLLNQGTIDASTEAKAYADAVVSEARARAHGDPMATAQAAIASAKIALQYATKPSERAAAIAQLIDAQNQLEDAQVAALESLVNLASARTSDPLAKAQLELQKAQIAIANAHGVAAENDALAQQANAQRAVSEAIADVFRSQQELVLAIAQAAGDVVGAAKDQLDIAQQNLANLLARKAAGDDPGEAAINRAKAQVVQSQAAVRDTEVSKRSQDIDVALQLEKITTAQAIAQFQALLQIPNLTVEETNQILLKIKQLKDSMNQTLQFNIPSEIQVPSVYQARRLAGVGATPGGPQSYQDNRQITINLSAYNQGDLSGAVDTIVSALGSRPRNGINPGVLP